MTQTLNEKDVVSAMMRQPTYLDEITEEMIPDDSFDLVWGTRKGKSEVKNFDHIVGVSDLNSRKKDREMR